MKRLLFVLCLAFTATHADGQLYQPKALTFWSEDSPDKQYRAATRPIPDPVYLWRPDLDKGRLIVISTKDLKDGIFSGHYVAYNFDRLTTKIEWSPDSEYLVMTTVSAGGHGPWHFDAYAYCVRDKTLRFMDDAIGVVTAPDFTFIGRHTVVMKVRGNDDLDHPASVTVDLSKELRRMPVQKGKTEGDNP